MKSFIVKNDELILIKKEEELIEKIVINEVTDEFIIIKDDKEIVVKNNMKNVVKKTDKNVKKILKKADKDVKKIVKEDKKKFFLSNKLSQK